MPAIYRYELAKTNRAQCQVAACKSEGVNIQKGELRFGSLVTIKEHDTWKWKHWGCVTPSQFANILDQIGGLDGLDVDKDLDILDGYDELPDWAQEKVKYALVNGHVHDDDWRGDPELNVPGAKGLRKRTPKKKPKEDAGEDGDDDQGASPKPKAKKGGSKKVVKDEEEDGEEPKKRKTTSRKRKAEIIDNEEEHDTEEAKPKPKKAAKKSKTTVKKEDVESDDPLDAEEEQVKRKPALKKTKTADKDEGDATEDPQDARNKPAKNRGKKVTDGAAAVDAQVDGGNDNTVDSKHKGARGKVSHKIKDEPEIGDNHKPVKSRRTRKVKDKPLEDAEMDVKRDDAVSKPSRSRRGKKVKAEPAYESGDDEVIVEASVARKSVKGRAKSNSKPK